MPDYNEPLLPPPEPPRPPRRPVWSVLRYWVCLACVAYTLYSLGSQLVTRYVLAPTVTPDRLVQIKPGMTYAQVYDLFDGPPTHRLMGQWPPGRGGQLEAGSYIWAQDRSGVWCLFGGGVLIRYEMILDDKGDVPPPEGFDR